MNLFNKLLTNGKTQFHVVEECKSYLASNGYELIGFSEIASLPEEGKYMVSPYPTMLVAFDKVRGSKGFRIAASHTDFPMLKIKPTPDVEKKGYRQLNIEPYGGLIKETWFDRPLGIAGRVIRKGKDAFHPVSLLFDSNKPVCVIPNLAPHLIGKDKKDNIDIQKEMLPIFSLSNGSLEDYLSREAGIAKDEILDFELYLYNTELPTVLGENNEFLCSPRIDNLSSVSAILEALCGHTKGDCNVVGVFYDNEEIGSRSKQGADSFVLRDILRQLSADELDIYNSLCLSVDVAHATHPNYIEKNDITNDIILGKGFVIKNSATQRYVTDSEATAILIGLCTESNISYIRQTNRSGMPGGQTLGPIMSSYLPVMSADIGVPILAMHSSNELMCISDYDELKKIITRFFS